MSNSFQKILINSISNPNGNFHLDIFRIISFKHGFRFKAHSHRRIELNYIIKGKCIMKFEDELITLNENNSIIIFPWSKHDFYVESKIGVKMGQLEFTIDEGIYKALKDSAESELSFLFNLNNNADGYLKIPNNPDIRNCMERIINENQQKFPHYDTLNRIYFLELIIILSRQINKLIQFQKNLENVHLKTALKMMHSEYCSDMSISVLAQKCNISTRYLRQLFISALGMNPITYCNNLKITKAKELLSRSDYSIKDIAYSLQYNTPQYFSKAFKNSCGLTPKKYRDILAEMND